MRKAYDDDDEDNDDTDDDHGYCSDHGDHGDDDHYHYSDAIGKGLERAPLVAVDRCHRGTARHMRI